MIRQQATYELARREFYTYCQVINPQFYLDDRLYLKDMCNEIQDFIENATERFLVVNMPPRHGKSYTAKNLTEWLFGFDTKLKVMTGSYNERLSTTFATQVRDTIATKKAGAKVVYNDIFPRVKIKHGEASAMLWALEGNTEKNYLATSPTGTATGFGANILIIDDIIKNSDEAYNEAVLDGHWEWFTNTMLQRTEGSNWKVIIIMTRWAEGDLAGRIIKAYDDVRVIKYSAVLKDGTMLCPSILNKKDYLLKTKEMNADIVEANYNQEPIDIKGRLYDNFKEWEVLPPHDKVRNQTDTADTGNDSLCSINYVVYDKEVYITDLVFTDAKMEETEEAVASLLVTGEVNESIIESNNGGRGFARNVARIIKDKHDSNKCVITPVPQTKNKVSRILTSSAWVQNHIYMPFGWKTRYPNFYKQVMGYMAKGKNAHDDGVDTLASIYEIVTGKVEPKVYSKTDIGLYGRGNAKKNYWR